MRGYLRIGRGQSQERGSIPAYAGLPAAEGEASAPPGVYPRVCGVTSSAMM